MINKVLAWIGIVIGSLAIMDGLFAESDGYAIFGGVLFVLYLLIILDLMKKGEK